MTGLKSIQSYDFPFTSSTRQSSTQTVIYCQFINLYAVLYKYKMNVIRFVELNNIRVLFGNLTGNSDDFLVYISVNVCFVFSVALYISCTRTANQFSCGKLGRTPFRFTLTKFRCFIKDIITFITLYRNI